MTVQQIFLFKSIANILYYGEDAYWYKINIRIIVLVQVFNHSFFLFLFFCFCFFVFVFSNRIPSRDSQTWKLATPPARVARNNKNLDMMFKIIKWGSFLCYSLWKRLSKCHGMQPRNFCWIENRSLRERINGVDVHGCNRRKLREFHINSRKKAKEKIYSYGSHNLRLSPSPVSLEYLR